MGKLIAVMNSGDTPIYVGDQVVVPGNTRHFDEDLVPDHLKPLAAPAEAPPPQPAVADALAAELGCEPEKILDAIAQVGDVGRITKLAEIELAAESPRQGVLDALGERQMVLAEELQRQQEAEAKAKADAEAKAAAARRR